MATKIAASEIGCPICQRTVAVLTTKDDQSLFRCRQCETMILVPKVAWTRTPKL
jgi:hypothetical protein